MVNTLNNSKTSQKWIFISYGDTCYMEERQYVDEICALLGYYEASCSNCLPMFQDVSVPSSRVGLLTREDGTGTLSRNVGKQLPHDAS
jgi:hypothetical protein